MQNAVDYVVPGEASNSERRGLYDDCNGCWFFIGFCAGVAVGSILVWVLG